MPKRAIDLTGRVFGFLAVESFSHSGNGAWWNCRCDCGAVVKLRACALLSNNNKSCGCKKAVLMAAHSTKHGEGGGKSCAESREYIVWKRMKARCLNPKERGYENYGGRGITICAGWMKSFPAFLKDMGRAPSDEHSIDRINNNGNYSCGECDECRGKGWPSNCRWATDEQQSSNKRSNRMVIYLGEQLTVAQLARKTGIIAYTLYRRLNKQMTPEQAVAFGQPSKRALVSNLEMVQLPLLAGEPSAAQSFKST